MQTLVQVVCSKGRSLRDAVVNDSKLDQFGLRLEQKLRPGRSHGWAKVRGAWRDRQGTLNIEWDADTNIMICRVVNRGAGRPHRVLGDFVEYLFERHRKRIEAVNIIPR